MRNFMVGGGTVRMMKASRRDNAPPPPPFTYAFEFSPIELDFNDGENGQVQILDTLDPADPLTNGLVFDPAWLADFTSFNIGTGWFIQFDALSNPNVDPSTGDTSVVTYKGQFFDVVWPGFRFIQSTVQSGTGYDPANPIIPTTILLNGVQQNASFIVQVDASGGPPDPVSIEYDLSTAHQSPGGAGPANSMNFLTNTTDHRQQPVAQAPVVGADVDVVNMTQNGDPAPAAPFIDWAWIPQANTHRPNLNIRFFVDFTAPGGPYTANVTIDFLGFTLNLQMNCTIT